MTRFSKCTPFTISALALLFPVAYAQSIPADTGSPPPPGVGFSLPRVGGSLNYGISASQLISNGFFNDSGVGYTTSLSGDLAYVSKSQFHPFSAVYSGGVLVGYDGQKTTAFQSLSFSQVLSTQHWNIVLSDSISYLPESPAVGLSGIPGVGDLGVDPINTVIGATPGLGILTTYGPRVSNSTSGTVSRTLTGRISLQATGDYSFQRFIGDNSGEGTNTSTYGGSVGLNYRLSGRDALAGNYNYSQFSFSDSPYSFSAQGASLSYSRQWTPRLTTSVSGGPQISSSNSTPALSGTFVTYAASASASYASRSTSYSLSYSRGINNGSGVIPGAISDSVSLGAHRQFGRVWAVSGDVSYSKNSSLPILNSYNFSTDSLAFSAQATRGFGRHFSGYASYTLEHQSLGGSGVGIAAPNAFSGLYQVVGLGVTYSPNSILLGR